MSASRNSNEISGLGRCGEGEYCRETLTLRAEYLQLGEGRSISYFHVLNVRMRTELRGDLKCRGGETKGEGVRLSGKKQTHSHTMGSVVVLGAAGEAEKIITGAEGSITERYELTFAVVGQICCYFSYPP